MSLKNRLKGLAIDALLSDPVRRARTGAHEMARRLRREEPRIELYYQADDPYSYLLAQVVPRLAELYPVTWSFHLVPPPAPDVDPEPALRRRNAVRDAHELARYLDVEFPEVRKPPEGTPVSRAESVLIRERPFLDQLAAARDVGAAMWSGDGKAMMQARGRHGYEGTGNIKPHAHRNYALLRKRGHFHGGVLRYGGEWFWGLDRLSYLEDRLRDDFDLPDAPSVLSLRPEDQRPAEPLPTDDDGRVPLDFFFSFRSPYSYLATDRVLELASRYPVRLAFRPVRPMVMRGLPVPRAKQLYIVQDAKREAERLGIPFGRISDPLGPGVERALAVFEYAERAGRPGEFLQSAMRAAWSEGLDLADDGDLERVVDRAGLDWEQARAALSDDGWKARADANAVALNKLDLWGVPSFQLGDYATWGQDRLFVIEDKLRAHLAR